jgi:hypothetical protein
MPTPKEIEVLENLSRSLSHLKGQYLIAGGAENRRDQLTVFINASMKAIAQLADEAGADPLVAIYSLDSVLQDLADSFVDAIDAEEAGQPDYSRPYSTLYVQGGSVVG